MQLVSIRCYFELQLLHAYHLIHEVKEHSLMRFTLRYKIRVNSSPDFKQRRTSNSAGL
jgi:hypothetical protein